MPSLFPTLKHKSAPGKGSEPLDRVAGLASHHELTLINRKSSAGNAKVARDRMNKPASPSATATAGSGIESLPPTHPTLGIFFLQTDSWKIQFLKELKKKPQFLSHISFT